MAVQLDPQLLEILACPCDEHASLTSENETLRCGACTRAFPVTDGIPVLLLDAALPGTGPGSPAPGKTVGHDG
ncbi:Trm112 family protein [Pseudonocardia phyllosphaerae]|uniref:Trm112 family protein n=1 Tax=Pseudonocardia phyllosphaerae TaxID=3390502 RepID=UPI00397CEA27